MAADDEMGHRVVERREICIGSTFFCPLPPFTSETSPFQQLSIAAEGTRREQLGTETENLQTFFRRFGAHKIE